MSAHRQAPIAIEPGESAFDDPAMPAEPFTRFDATSRDARSRAWQGPGGGSDENADKCAWNNNGGVSTNISLGGHNYAVQPIWSNDSTTGTGSHCVTSHT